MRHFNTGDMIADITLAGEVMRMGIDVFCVRNDQIRVVQLDIKISECILMSHYLTIIETKQCRVKYWKIDQVTLERFQIYQNSYSLIWMGLA